MKTQLLLFDFDGTLYNTAPGIFKAVNIVAEEKGVQAFSFELIKDVIGFGLEHLLQQIDEESRHKLGNLDSLRTRFLEVYADIAMSESSLFPGSIEFLQSWPHKLGIVSNKTQNILRHMVKASKLGQFKWEVVVGGDTYPQKKPHPMPILEAMDLAGHGPQDTLLVGDGIPDVLATKAASVPFIGVDFGYAPINLLQQKGCQYFISDYSDLLQQIQIVDAKRL